MKRNVTRLTLDPQGAGEFGVERHFGEEQFVFFSF